MKCPVRCGAWIAVAALFLAGCAGLSHGIRIYPQKIYLFVDKEKGQSRIVSLPDIKNGYDVKPWAFMSKHTFTVKIDEAQIKELTSDQDSTAALALLQKIVEVGGQLATEAIKAGAPIAGKAVANIDIASAFGLQTGVYEFDEQGALKRLGP